jgi:CDP-archaeol synthase
MQPVVVVQLLLLLLVANGIPVVAKDILGDRLAYPVDGRIRFIDGQPLLGSSKTVRGVLLSVLATSVCAPLVGVDWEIGLWLGCAAMAGDLLSSFFKRRMRLPSGARATCLDQVPESLFPLLACRSALSLTAADMTVAVGLFLIGEVFLSRWLFRAHLRDRPY